MTTLPTSDEPLAAAAQPGFPQGFLWGAATSAYQIEGAVDAGGRGRSIWDDFCARPGKVANGESGARACDHYHLWREDVALMRSLGLGAYRFSISWPRIQPAGRGAANAAGLDFYDRLVDGLLEAGIRPFATLYHWDLPSALEAEGGWRARPTCEAFAEYAAIVAERLGDRVEHWTTFNEPFCIADLDHGSGEQAPGRRDSRQVVRQVNHHILLAHGLAAQAVRASAPGAVQVGFVQLTTAPEPLLEDDASIEAAREGYRRHNAMIFDPLCRGSYPADILESLGADAPHVADGDLATIHQPLDYVGINSYSSWEVVDPSGRTLQPEPSHPRTHMGWPITPDALYWAVRFTNEIYAPKAIHITESGCAYPDEVNADGEVLDTARIAYLKAHLRGLQRAAMEGHPVKGYFLWSLLDNFEWAHGYAKRFGIVHVNFETLKRTPKLSAGWYGRVAQLNRV